MKILSLIKPIARLTLFLTFSSGISKAQLIENSVPAPTNINQNQCPCIMPDNSVVFQVKAPNAQKIQKMLDLFYISCGEGDMRIEHTKKAVATMKDKGLKVEFNSFPGDHEWQVWRKSLHDFASRVFK